MEYILLGILFAPFILVAGYITISILFKIFVTVWVDALSIIGFDGPKQYVKYEWNI